MEEQMDEGSSSQAKNCVDQRQRKDHRRRGTTGTFPLKDPQRELRQGGLGCIISCSFKSSLSLSWCCFGPSWFILRLSLNPFCLVWGDFKFRAKIADVGRSRRTSAPTKKEKLDHQRWWKMVKKDEG